MITVALDCMGGDKMPDCNLEGALAALQEEKEVCLQLIGNPLVIRDFLKEKTYDASRVEIIESTEVIETGEHAVSAINQKKDSSLVLGLKRLKEGLCDAFVSAGSTGAILVGGQVLTGRLHGVKRAPLAVLLPTENGKSVLLDAGANVDAKPENLLQFAIMGSLYAKEMLGIPSPTVGLINIGAEEEKGNILCRETYPLLASSDKIHFIGNIEARDIPKGVADVYVAEAFTGNIVLKLYEGVAKTLIHKIKAALLSTLRGKIGGLLIKPSLKGMMKSFDSEEEGGAPMLGLNGLVIKAHGSSSAYAIKNAIQQACRLTRAGLVEKVKCELSASKEEKRNDGI